MAASIPWELGVYDAHCHPTDTMAAIATVASMKARTLTIMATRSSDQELVAAVARSQPRSKIVPSFGFHPWFAHLIYDDGGGGPAHPADEAELKRRHYSAVLVPPPDADLVRQLPAPQPLSQALGGMRAHLEEFPHALVGEIGLDRGFRLPFPDSSDPSDSAPAPRRLSPHRVSIDHQKRVFTAQLQLAGALSRAVSVHGVQCHGVLFETFRDLWRGHELPRERRKDARRRRRRRRSGDGHEYLPDMCDSDDSGDAEDSSGAAGAAGAGAGGAGAGAASGDHQHARPFPPRICLHSFSAPLETLRQYLSPPGPTTLCPSQLFFSFSTTINARPQKGHLARIAETIAAVPDDCVLVESDLHTAGDEADEALADALLFVTGVKEWEVGRGVRQLGRNWRRFVYGDDDDGGDVVAL